MNDVSFHSGWTVFAHHLKSKEIHLQDGASRLSGSETASDLLVPFPLEIVIDATPVSSQTKNNKAREAWERKVGAFAKKTINGLRDQYFLDDRPLMATIFYFPPTSMPGDIDNIVKPILDGMISIAYPNDRLIERIVVQKFEPDVDWVFSSPSPALASAIDMEKPALYIRLEDDLTWRRSS